MAEMNLTKITIIEDDRTIREGYQQLLAAVPGYTVCSACDSVEAAIHDLGNTMPDIILLDIHLKGMSGIEGIPFIKKVVPLSKIIMLTAYEDPELIFTALSNGAAGYLSKSIPAAKLIHSIEDIVQGGGSFSAGVAKLIIQSFQKNKDTPLTKREKEVLLKMTEGKSRSQIANDLFVDSETIKTHIKNIYIKLDVHSRSEAIRIAKLNRFI
jgi:DNA-binding NarL/FixJ family response regulator